jgi:hypothetical protein
MHALLICNVFTKLSYFEAHFCSLDADLFLKGEGQHMELFSEDIPEDKSKW